MNLEVTSVWVPEGGAWPQTPFLSQRLFLRDPARKARADDVAATHVDVDGPAAVDAVIAFCVGPGDVAIGVTERVTRVDLSSGRLVVLQEAFEVFCVLAPNGHPGPRASLDDVLIGPAASGRCDIPSTRRVQRFESLSNRTGTILIAVPWSLELVHQGANGVCSSGVPAHQNLFGLRVFA